MVVQVSLSNGYITEEYLKTSNWDWFDFVLVIEMCPRTEQLGFIREEKSNEFVIQFEEKQKH